MARKVLMVLGIITVLFIGFKIFGWINRDDTRPLLDHLAQTNSLIVALSESADATSNYQLRIAAGNIHTVVLSNNQLLNERYQKEFGKKPASKATTKAVEELEANTAGSAYDQAFTTTVKEALEANQQTLASLVQKNKPEFQEMIDFIKTEQAELITQLP